MLSNQPFERRIIIAFVLMTVIVSGLFSRGIVVAVHFIEEYLISESLGRELQEALHEYLQRGHPSGLHDSTQFFASDRAEYAIPKRFTGLSEGFTEIETEKAAFYAFVKEVNGKTYMLVQDQSEFERHEQALFDVVLGGFLFAVLIAWVLGIIMARKVMAPLSRLAKQVRQRDQLHPLAPPLAPGYPNDEVGQLAASFDSVLGKMHQSLESERLFTSDVSHELRTPLMVIASSCELLAEAHLGAKEKEQLARIRRACEEMRGLVQTFLQLARDKQQGSFVDSHSLELIADEQAKRWEPMFNEKGLDFQWHIEGKDTGIYNETLLSTVMANLLRNALHYTEVGSVQLVLEQGGFRVEDSGMGIPADQHERIFQPFVRGSQARGEGLGLGLSLVRRICARQGWSINVRDRDGGGSCFNVTLNSIE